MLKEGSEVDEMIVKTYFALSLVGERSAHRPRLFKELIIFPSAPTENKLRIGTHWMSDPGTVEEEVGR